jgi:hypothetical protein
MEQYNDVYIAYTKGRKTSPASPASPAQRARPPSKGRLEGAKVSNSPSPIPATTPRLAPSHPAPSETRQPAPVIVDRVRRLFTAVRPLLDQEVTTAWLARTLVRVDGGPMLDAPRLGPALRALGFRPMRRRWGTRRVSIWLPPASPPARIGRPRGSQQCGTIQGLSGATAGCPARPMTPKSIPSSNGEAPFGGC